MVKESASSKGGNRPLYLADFDADLLLKLRFSNLGGGLWSHLGARFVSSLLLTLIVLEWVGYRWHRLNHAAPF